MNIVVLFLHGKQTWRTSDRSPFIINKTSSLSFKVTNCCDYLKLQYVTFSLSDSV